MFDSHHLHNLVKVLVNSKKQRDAEEQAMTVLRSHISGMVRNLGSVLQNQQQPPQSIRIQEKILNGSHFSLHADNRKIAFFCVSDELGADRFAVHLKSDSLSLTLLEVHADQLLNDQLEADLSLLKGFDEKLVKAVEVALSSYWLKGARKAQAWFNPLG